MQYLVDFPGSARRIVASCTDCDEEPAPGGPEDPFEGMPEGVAAGVRAAFEREAEVESVEDCRRVWLDQMPFFVGALERVETLRAAFADVAYRVEIQREGARDWGELHALGALAASDIPVLAIAGERDRAQPPANARRIAEAAPRGELLVIDGRRALPVRRGSRGLLGQGARLVGAMSVRVSSARGPLALDAEARAELRAAASARSAAPGAAARRCSSG